MKNTIRLFVFVAFVMAAMGVSAQTAAVKLGHIDVDQLIQAMPEAADAQKKLEAQQAELEKELATQQETYQKMLAEYAEKSKTYSDVIRAAKEQELQDLGQRIQRFRETAMNELEKAQRTLMQPIWDKALNAIKAVSKEGGFTYVFNMGGGTSIVYAAENSQDVLPLVKKKLGLQ